MARLSRINLPFCLYHVTSRTNSGDVAFTNPKEINKFLVYLAKYADIFAFRIHAWCLLPNHFHLLMESTGEEGLSELMRRLLTAYTIYYNRRHQRHGHLFQGRFNSYVVDKADYFLEVSRYIHLNPARNEKPSDPETYLGSSFRYYLRGHGPAFLYMTEILSRFPGGLNDYVHFVHEGLEKDAGLLPVSRRRFVGDPDFAQRFIKRIKSYESKRQNREKPGESAVNQEEDQADSITAGISQKFGFNVEQIKTGVRSRGKLGRVRKLCMAEIRNKLPWTYKKIGEYFHVHSVYAVQYNINAINTEHEKSIREK